MLGVLSNVGAGGGAPPVLPAGTFAPDDLPWFDENVNNVTMFVCGDIGGTNTNDVILMLVYVFTDGSAAFFNLWTNAISAEPPPTLGLVMGTAATGPAVEPSLVFDSPLILDCRTSWQTNAAFANATTVASAAAAVPSEGMAGVFWRRYVNMNETLPPVGSDK
jgi:hypothetical protein